MPDQPPDLLELLASRFRAHPWHGVSIGDKAPHVVTVYIEIVSTDTVKYELDKTTGILKVDRPQRFSNVCPSLYGLLPQTYCAEAVAELCEQRTGRTGIHGDGDPLDICVLTEKTFPHGDIILRAHPIGGLRVIDNNEADDKIIAVMEGDLYFGAAKDLSDCPTPIIDRLKHYFMTYKEDPNTTRSPTKVVAVYDADEAREVITRSQTDYRRHFVRPG
jgi:inorganic pyrophosphatase